MKKKKQLEEFDALVAYMKTLPRSTARIVVPERMYQFQTACRTAEELAEETDATFDAELREMDGYAVIRLESADFIFYHSAAFAEIVHVANNFETYPLKNGKMRLAFMFYGITKCLEGKK